MKEITPADKSLHGLRIAGESTFRRVAALELSSLANHVLKLGRHLEQHPNDIRAQETQERLVQEALQIAQENNFDSVTDPADQL